VCKCGSILLAELIVCHSSGGCQCEDPPSSGLHRGHVSGTPRWGRGRGARQPLAGRRWLLGPGLRRPTRWVSALPVPSALGSGASVAGAAPVGVSAMEERVFGERCLGSGVLPGSPGPCRSQKTGVRHGSLGPSSPGSGGGLFSARAGVSVCVVGAGPGTFAARRRERGAEGVSSPSPGRAEVVRQVQCGGLGCRPAVSCGFHGN